jgi:hypothetical protein
LFDLGHIDDGADVVVHVAESMRLVLTGELRPGEPPKAALHSHMAQIFREKAEALAAALEHDEQRDAARLALRRFIEQIVIPPGDGLLQVIGNLGEMLPAAGARNGTAPAAVGIDGCGGRI